MAKGNRSLRYTSEADMPAPMRALYAQQLERIAPPLAPGSEPAAAAAPPAARPAHAQHQRGVMNKTEKAYADFLDARVRAGEVREWLFERITLWLAPKTTLTPDFTVILPCGTTEFHEVKGFWHEDARVKTKVAAASFPFRIVAVQRKRGQWLFEEFPRGGK